MFLVKKFASFLLILGIISFPVGCLKAENMSVENDFNRFINESLDRYPLNEKKISKWLHINLIKNRDVYNVKYSKNLSFNDVYYGNFDGGSKYVAAYFYFATKNNVINFSVLKKRYPNIENGNVISVDRIGKVFNYQVREKHVILNFTVDRKKVKTGIVSEMQYINN